MVADRHRHMAVTAVVRRQQSGCRRSANYCRTSSSRGLDTCWTHSWRLEEVWQRRSSRDGQAARQHHNSQCLRPLGPHCADRYMWTSACWCSCSQLSRTSLDGYSSCSRQSGASLVLCSISSQCRLLLRWCCPVRPLRPLPRSTARQCFSSYWRPVVPGHSRSVSQRSSGLSTPPVTTLFRQTSTWICSTCSPLRTSTATLSRLSLTSCHSATNLTSASINFTSRSSMQTLAAELFLQTSIVTLLRCRVVNFTKASSPRFIYAKVWPFYCHFWPGRIVYIDGPNSSWLSYLTVSASSVAFSKIVVVIL